MAEPKEGVKKRTRPRTCVGCNKESPKKALLRIVRSPEGQVFFDPTGKAAGRGAYLCADPACIVKAKKKKALSRALKAEVEEAFYDRLLELCAGFHEENFQK